MPTVWDRFETFVKNNENILPTPTMIKGASMKVAMGLFTIYKDNPTTAGDILSALFSGKVNKVDITEGTGVAAIGVQTLDTMKELPAELPKEIENQRAHGRLNDRINQSYLLYPVPSVHNIVAFSKVKVDLGVQVSAQIWKEKKNDKDFTTWFEGSSNNTRKKQNIWETNAGFHVWYS